MSVFICKMCGGTLDISEGMTVCNCKHCGNIQTVPSNNTERALDLFSRANQLWSDCEFDTAARIFKRITVEFPEEAEAFWGVLLCKFGIRYVDDPATGKKVPEIHRLTSRSILDDNYYEQTMINATADSRKVYREAANDIDSLQKKMLEISSREKPFDIYICYKETDEAGNRTDDSVIAQRIYDMLTSNGYRVYFSRVSDKEKSGMGDEPFAFAALNSAKIMLVVGTDCGFYYDVWVRNEWIRFLSLMSDDSETILIPCCRDIEPEDMPEEFSSWQALDMGKSDAMQELLSGIKMIMPKGTGTIASKPAPAPVREAVNINSLLKKIFELLENDDWESAGQCCDKVLEADAKNGYAFCGKLMIDLKVGKRGELKNQDEPFDHNDYYRKIMQCGDEKLKNWIQGCIDFINNRNRSAFQESIYKKAVSLFENPGSTKEQIVEAKNLFESISGYKNSENYVYKFDDRIKEVSYNKAVSIYNNTNSSKSDITKARTLFESIKDYRDSEKYISIYDERIKEAEYQRAVFIFNDQYSTSSDIGKAQSIFKSLGKYKDSESFISKVDDRIIEADYQEALHLYSDRSSDIKDYKTAKKMFQSLSGYKDSDEYALKCDDRIQDKKEKNIQVEAKKTLYNAKEVYKSDVKKLEIIETQIDALEKAGAVFESSTDDDDSKKRARECNELKDKFLEMKAKMEADLKAAQDRVEKQKQKKKKTRMITIIVIAVAALALFSVFSIIPDIKYKNADALLEDGKYEEAIAAFEELGSYKDSSYKIELAEKGKKYNYASSLLKSGQYKEAAAVFKEIWDYKDSYDKLNQAEKAANE